MNNYYYLRHNLITLLGADVVVSSMVLSKSFRVLRKWRPCRSVLLESRSISDQALLFESDCAAVLGER